MIHRYMYTFGMHADKHNYMGFFKLCFFSISAGIFMKAKGIAILTVVKAGFLVTARGGSGIVIAKVNDGIGAGKLYFQLVF